MLVKTHIRNIQSFWLIRFAVRSTNLHSQEMLMLLAGDPTLWAMNPEHKMHEEQFDLRLIPLTHWSLQGPGRTSKTENCRGSAIWTEQPCGGEEREWESKKILGAFSNPNPEGQVQGTGKGKIHGQDPLVSWLGALADQEKLQGDKKPTDCPTLKVYI